VRPVTVVLCDELLDRSLRRFHRGEQIMVIEQFAAQREVEPFDLAGRGRRRRLSQPVSDAVVAADLVEQHLPALPEPVGELLAIEFLTDVKPLWWS
jgi:hypothetical protein